MDTCIKRMLLFLCLACISFKTCFAQVDLEQLKSDIAETLKCRSNPGVAVSVVKDGKVVFAEGFGESDIENNIKMTNSTLFGIASVSKSFAATLLVKLVSKRKDLNLQTKVKDILGDDFGFSEKFRTDHTTLEDLLSHRTGLPSNNRIRLNSNLTRDDLAKRIKLLPVIGQWRGSFIYNNLIYGLVTTLAEKIGGKSWEELVQEELYDPLGMTSSHFATQVDFALDNVAKAYRKDTDGSLYRVSPEFSRRWGLLCGSGCVMTTAEDIANWMRFHLSRGLSPDGDRVMKKEDMDELYKPRNNADINLFKLFNRPDVPVTTHLQQYALGWRLGYYRGYRMIGHSGSTFGYRALLTFFPSENLGIFVSMLGVDINYVYRAPLHNYIADHFLGETPWLNVSTICTFPQPWYPKSNSSGSKYKMEKTLSRDSSYYTGVYNNKAFGNMIIHYNESAGQLAAEYGFGRWWLYEQDGDDFYGAGYDINRDYGISSLTFKTVKNSKFDAIVVKGFESKAPPVFSRPGKTTASGQSASVLSLFAHFVVIVISAWNVISL